MKLKIAVHKGCKNKTNPQKVAKGWLNIYEDINWLEGWVKAGYGWCATHFVDRHRLTEHSSGSNVIVIDVDGDTTLARFWQTDTARQWCAATYTSSSHTETEHRFRALFPLGKELQSVSEHRGAYWLVVNRLIADLGFDKLKDNCGQKPERLWYGNTSAEFSYNLESEPVPQFLLDDISYDEDNFVASDVTDIDIERCKWLLSSFLRPSEDGEYEDYYLPVMAACAGVGQALFDTWVDWVLSGHHGEKNENIQPFKWKGLGTFSGHTTLYSLAKKQDPAWTKHLPSELRFGAVGSAVGYTEVDPLVSFDDVINTAGHLVGPFEVESALIEHPAVAEAGVIGKPDPIAMEIVKAFVTLNPDYEQTDQLRRELIRFSREKLSAGVAPREIDFLDTMPKTRSGKIMRRLLKARELGEPEGDISTLEDD